MYGKRSSGFSLIELLIVLVILVMLITIAFAVIEIRYRTLVKTEVIIFIGNFNASRKIATMSPKGKTAIIFRPPRGPYDTYYISSDIQKEKYFHLATGITIINTNGLIQNHALRVAVNGAILDDFGNPRIYPNPGILTFKSIDTDKVYQVKINPNTGEIWYE